MTRSLVAISAGLGTPSTSRLLADQLADATRVQVSARGEATEIVLIELRELASDLATMMATGMAPSALDEAFEAVRAADGVIAVSPVFQASYSGLFKMFFDALPQASLDGAPVLLGATAGTARHSMVVDVAMRPLFAYMRADMVPTGVFAATDDFGGADDFNARVRRAAEELADRMVRQADAVVGFRANSFEDSSAQSLTPARGFADMLKGHSGRRSA